MREALLPLDEFLWRTWGALGVSAWARRPPSTIVDLEALIVLTIVVHDERLTEATIRWARSHARILAPSRLRHLGRALDLVAETSQWLQVALADEPSLAGTRTRDGDGDGGAALPRDPFASALRARAVMGSTSRSEILRVLQGVVRGHVDAVDTSELVRSAAASRRQVLDAVADLERAGIVVRRGTERRRLYAPAVGDPFAEGAWAAARQARFAPWTQIVLAVAPLVRQVSAGALTERDPGRLADLLDALEQARDHAASVGVPVVLPARPITGTRAVVRRDATAAVEQIVAAVVAVLDDGLQRG